jgi:hypothetical protein
MAEEITESALRQKDWVSPADEIEQRGDSSLFEWRHDSYLAFTQMQEAISDPDVQICDVEHEDDQVVVNLQAMDASGPDEYPTRSLSELSGFASTRFEQKQDDPQYGGWDEEDLYYHLRAANYQIDSVVDIDDTFEQKEQISDAVNYLLFAYSVIDADDS